MTYDKLREWLDGEGETEGDCVLVLVFPSVAGYNGFCQNYVLKTGQIFVEPDYKVLANGQVKVSFKRPLAGMG